MPRRCSRLGCATTPWFNLKGRKQGMSCAEHASEGMVDLRQQICARQDCEKTLNRSMAGNKYTIFCADHFRSKTKKTRSIKECGQPRCTTGAIFGAGPNSPVRFCKKHAKDGMYDVCSKRCAHESCSKRPTHALAGAKIGEFCAAHCKEGMVRAGYYSHTCRQEGCTTTPSYGVPGSRTTLFCVRHAAEGMVNVCTKKCAHEGCTTMPTWGVKGTKRGEFCAKHAKPGMGDVVSRRCGEDGCEKRPAYGIEGSKKTEFCAVHAKVGMVNIGSKRCLHEGCKTSPWFGERGERSRLYCGVHRKEGMVSRRKIKKNKKNTVVVVGEGGAEIQGSNSNSSPSPDGGTTTNAGAGDKRQRKKRAASTDRSDPSPEEHTGGQACELARPAGESEPSPSAPPSPVDTSAADASAANASAARVDAGNKRRRGLRALADRTEPSPRDTGGEVGKRARSAGEASPPSAALGPVGTSAAGDWQPDAAVAAMEEMELVYNADIVKPGTVMLKEQEGATLRHPLRCQPGAAELRPFYPPSSDITGSAYFLAASSASGLRGSRQGLFSSDRHYSSEMC